MKANCEFCGKDISKNVFQAMTKNEIGRIQCPHCKRENKRYLSELDLLFCFLLNSIVYGIMIIAFIFVTTLSMDPNNPYSLVVYFISIAVSLTICYIFTKQCNIYQYNSATLKKPWLNQKIDESADEISSRMNFNLIVLILIVVVIGAQPEWFYFFLFMQSAFVLLTAIKVFFLQKKEFASLPKKK